MFLRDYPGMTRGLAKMQRVEDVLRTFSMLPLPERINGVEVRQLTPRHLDLLILVQSPFLIRPEKRRALGIRLQAEHVGQFLWIVRETGDEKPAAAGNPTEEFYASLRPDDATYFRRFYRAIDRYYERATIDEPMPLQGSRAVPTALSVSLCHRMGAAYSWEDEVTLDKPIARLFQYVSWIRIERDHRTPMVSRLRDFHRDRIVRKWHARAKAAGCTVEEVVAAHRERRAPKGFFKSGDTPDAASASSPM